MAFTVSTPDFVEVDYIPRQFTCDGNDEVQLLTLANPPQETRSYAIIMDDPDAPKGTFTHWLAYDIPADGDVLGPSAGKSLQNDFGRKGYGGPCPPPGHGPHRYYFTVYAVDSPALSVRGDSRRDLETALAKHTLATARVMGRYERHR
jgi:Raf kinase inhibitor-like YbhB/YbcL family protein